MIAKHKGEVPVLLLLLPFLLGLGLGMSWLSRVNADWLLTSLVIVTIIFIALNITYRQFKLYKNRWVGGVLITIFLFILGCFSVINYKEINSNNHFSKIHSQFMLVKISNEPAFKNGLLRFTADVKQGVDKEKPFSLSGTLLIAIKDSAAKSLYYGDELLIATKYNPIDPPFVPASFNYKNYLVNQNIYYQAFLTHSQYAVVDSNKGNPVIAYSLRLRQRLVEKLKTNVRDTDAAAVASTLILGYKADLSNDVLQAYSKTGTVHVLSVSGAHVAIIYILLSLAFGFLDRHRYGKLLKATIIIAIIWYYSLLSGFSPAVCRAAVMISMVIIGKTFNRHINTLNILAISAFLLLLYNPLFIVDVGFQLSYTAIFGLVAFQPLVYECFKFKNTWADKLWALCSVSIAAQVITFPLSAFYFHQFPIYFLVSNLFIIVPSAVIMYSGILFLLLPHIPFVTPALAFVLEKTIILMNKGLTFVEKLPYASVSKIWLTVPEYLLLCAIIIIGFYFLFSKRVWVLKFALTCTLLFFVSISVKKIMATDKNAIAFLNLKKHQGIVFNRGHDFVVLTDIKSADKTWQYNIQPYLDSCQADNVKVDSLNETVNAPFLIKRNNLVQFLNKKVIILDGENIGNYYTPTPDCDYVYLANNFNYIFNKTSNNQKNSVLVLDGTNSDHFIKRVKDTAKVKNTPIKLLKRNISFIAVSN